MRISAHDDGGSVDGGNPHSDRDRDRDGDGDSLHGSFVAAAAGGAASNTDADVVVVGGGGVGGGGGSPVVASIVAVSRVPSPVSLAPLTPLSLAERERKRLEQQARLY